MLSLKVNFISVCPNICSWNSQKYEIWDKSKIKRDFILLFYSKVVSDVSREEVRTADRVREGMEVKKSVSSA